MDENIRTVEQLQHNVCELVDLLLEGLVQEQLLLNFKESVNEAFENYYNNNRQ